MKKQRDIFGINFSKSAKMGKFVGVNFSRLQTQRNALEGGMIVLGIFAGTIFHQFHFVFKFHRNIVRESRQKN